MQIKFKVSCFQPVHFFLSVNWVCDNLTAETRADLCRPAKQDLSRPIKWESHSGKLKKLDSILSSW